MYVFKVSVAPCTRAKSKQIFHLKKLHTLESHHLRVSEVKSILEMDDKELKKYMSNGKKNNTR